MMRSSLFHLRDALLILCGLLFVIHGGRGARLVSHGPSKTIQTKGGDIFDCFEINKQPAFDNPLLKDHKIQLRPSSYPKELLSKDAQKRLPVNIELAEGGCPKGTVPIHRLSKSANSPIVQLEEKQSLKRMYAVRKSYEGNYSGASAEINVFNLEPNTYKNETSVSAVWVLNKNAPYSKQSKLLAGWMVNPLLFGDQKTRIFMRWTVDGGNYSYTNFQHPGFVQIHNTCALGLEIWPPSDYIDKNQYFIRTVIYRDPVTGNWWLAIEGNYMGYWPKELFYNFDHATEVYYGGMVSCHLNDNCPPMGSGVNPITTKDEDACSINQPRFLDNKNSWQDMQPEMQFPYANVPECYTVGPYEKDEWGYNFKFGGGLCFIEPGGTE